MLGQRPECRAFNIDGRTNLVVATVGKCAQCFVELARIGTVTRSKEVGLYIAVGTLNAAFLIASGWRGPSKDVP